MSNRYLSRIGKEFHINDLNDFWARGFINEYLALLASVRFPPLLMYSKITLTILAFLRTIYFLFPDVSQDLLPHFTHCNAKEVPHLHCSRPQMKIKEEFDANNRPATRMLCRMPGRPKTTSAVAAARNALIRFRIGDVGECGMGDVGKPINATTDSHSK